MITRPNIAILVGSQGRGSNMINIIRASKNGGIPANVGLVISPKADTPAIFAAQAENIPTLTLPYKSENYANKLLTELQNANISLICLAGYMTLLPREILEAFPRAVLNIHPALLPKFGGKGMFGVHVHNAVLRAQETESGCTVHYVTEHYDEGAPITQISVPVLPNDTPETLGARVNLAEMEAYPKAICKVLSS